MLKRHLLLTALAVTMSVAGSAQTSRRLTIDEMFSLLENANRSIRTSQTGIEAAREGMKSARSQRLPDISTRLSASYIGNVLLMDRDFSDIHGMHSPHFGNQFTVDAQQTVYAGGAVNAGVHISELGLEKAEASTDLTRQQQRLLVLGQYLDLEKLTNRERVLQSNIELTERLIDDIQERHRQGVALKNDITRYELQMETLRLNLTKLRNQRAVISHQLCNALDIDGDVTLEPADDVAAMTFGKEGEGHWQQTAALNSPQLRMASVDERMSGQQLRLARSALLPKVAFVASNNFNGPITFELPPIDKNLNVWYIGVGVSYQLSSLFKSNHSVRQAKIETREAAERKAVAQEQVNNQMQAAWVAYQQTYDELETQKKSVELARENYQVVNDRYLNQLALVTDMLDASNMRLDAELAEADARINIAYAYYKMKYIAGEL